MAFAGAPGRGGWSFTLQTANLLDDLRDQDSLSQSLRRGTGMAHRQTNLASGEFRNVRRTNPIKMSERRQKGVGK